MYKQVLYQEVAALGAVGVGVGVVGCTFFSFVSIFLTVKHANLAKGNDGNLSPSPLPSVLWITTGSTEYITNREVQTRNFSG